MIILSGMSDRSSNVKSVMISIKPKWCKLISSGEKTIEVRKTRPKIETPFKCYIYCTNDFADSRTRRKSNEFWVGQPLNNISKGRYIGNGKVIGEFICDGIDKWEYTTEWNSRVEIDDDEIVKTCLDRDGINKYSGGKPLYGWHISDLVVYDMPEDIDDFMIFGKDSCDCKNCDTCLYMGVDKMCEIKDFGQPLFRPPQSWCYCEDLN